MVKLSNFLGESMRKQLEDKKLKLQAKIDKIVNDAEAKLEPLNKQMETNDALLAVLDEHETRPDKAMDNPHHGHADIEDKTDEKLPRL